MGFGVFLWWIKFGNFVLFVIADLGLQQHENRKWYDCIVVLFHSYGFGSFVHLNQMGRGCYML